MRGSAKSLLKEAEGEESTVRQWISSVSLFMDIASAFGPLKAFKFLVKNDANEYRAFLQNVDQCITPKACSGFDGMKLGGQTLNDIKSPLTYEIPETAIPLLADPTELLVVKNVFDPERISLLSQPEIRDK